MRENAINERRNFFLETLDKGLKEGRKEGEKRKAIEIAKSLLDVLDIETISLKTGLSVDEINKLK